MRVYELAKEVRIPNKDLIAKIRALGLEVNNHLSSLDADDVARIRRSLEKEEQSVAQRQPTQPVAPTTVLRRRSAEEKSANAHSMGPATSPVPTSPPVIRRRVVEQPVSKAASVPKELSAKLATLVKGLWTSVNKEERALLLVDLPAIKAAWAGEGMDLAAVERFIMASLRSSEHHTLYFAYRELVGRGAR